jgi:hypothetical protein
MTVDLDQSVTTTWRRSTALDFTFHDPEHGALPAEAWTRMLAYGKLLAHIGSFNGRLRMTLSFAPHTPGDQRSPTWGEVCHARSSLLPADREFVLLVPNGHSGMVLVESPWPEQLT